MNYESQGSDASPEDSGEDILRRGGELFPFGEVPFRMDSLPESGKEVLIIGAPEKCCELNHRQGDNPFGFKGTCGLVACEDVLRQFGFDVDEADVVQHALGKGLCAVSEDPRSCGGTTADWQAKILTNGGVPAHTEFSAGIGDLFNWVNEGRGIIIEVNCGELWNDPDTYESGQANHAIVVTGVALEPHNGQIIGFYINDSGRGYHGDSGRFVPLELMQRAWTHTGGACVVTDLTKTTWEPHYDRR